LIAFVRAAVSIPSASGEKGEIAIGIFSGVLSLPSILLLIRRIDQFPFLVYKRLQLGFVLPSAPFPLVVDLLCSGNILDKIFPQ